tara:strand:+ start:271 stop:612 length:342 start_codon:yes stop_codon:yes gene_type:complete
MSIITDSNTTTTTIVTTETFDSHGPDLCMCEAGESHKTPEYSYEVISLDKQSCCFVEPDGPITSACACTISDFTEDTGVDLATLQKHALSGEPMTIAGEPGQWTVGNCISNYP